MQDMLCFVHHSLSACSCGYASPWPFPSHSCLTHVPPVLLHIPCRQALPDPNALAKVQAAAAELLAGCRFSHMTGNFLAAVASHHHLLANQPGLRQWLLEAMQWSKATEVQRKDMQVTGCRDICIYLPVCLSGQFAVCLAAGLLCGCMAG